MDITIESFKPFVKHLQGIMLVCFFLLLDFFLSKTK
jgi:hypothetical protein